MCSQISASNASFDIGARDLNEGMVGVVCTDVGYRDSELKYVFTRIKAKGGNGQRGLVCQDLWGKSIERRESWLGILVSNNDCL